MPAPAPACWWWHLSALRKGWIGGGDAKLAAVTVLWLGLGHLADYLVYASLLGGALTIAIDPVSHHADAAAARAGNGPSGCIARTPAFPTASRWR